MEENKTKGLQDLVAKKITDQGNAVICYLDLSPVQPDPVYDPNSLATEILGLSSFTKFVELSEERVTSTISREQIQDIQKLHDIDANAMLCSALENEMDQTIDRRIRTVMNGLASGAAESESTKFQKWANKWFGYEPKYFLGEVNSQEFSRKLVTKILLHTNKIAKKCRRGPANFIICGSEMGSIIQDHSSFIFNPLDNGARSLRSAGLYYVGHLAGLEVYVDPYMKWADKRITLGRKTTTLDQPGIVFITQEPTKETIASVDTLESKVIIQQRMYIGAVGSAQDMFYEFQISEKPHNLFTHIVDSIKAKISKKTSKK
jgi:hypothetical protein